MSSGGGGQPFGGSTQYGGSGNMMGGFRPMSRMGYQQSAPSGFSGFGQQALGNDAQMRANYMRQPQMANSSPVPQQPTPTDGGFPIPYQMPIFGPQESTSAGWWNRANAGRQMSTGNMEQQVSPIPQTQSPTNNGFTPPYQMPIFPGPTNTSEGWWRQAGQPRGGLPEVGGQFNPMTGSQNLQAPRQMPQMSSGNMEQATPQTQPITQPQQTFEQFAATMGNNGMTSGQLNDAYQKSIQQQSAPTNFWANVGPGGTQNPFPGKQQPFPSQWGNQTFGFDPKSMAGKQVTGDLGWYYGRDAIGRTIGQDGNAMAGFSGAADGFNRSRPWG